MSVTSAELALEGVRLVASVVYGVVAYLVLRRPVDVGARLARAGFATWWLGIAVVGLASIPSGLGLTFAEYGLGAVRAWIYVIFGAIFVALAGLVYYLLFLYTGRSEAWRGVALFYVLLFVYLVYLMEGFGPYTGVEDGTASLLFEQEHPPLLLLGFSLAISLPPLAAAASYLMLFFKLDDRESRYRILLVSGGLGGWFLYSVLGTVFRFITETEQTYVGTVVGQLVGLVAATMVLVAFAPPGRVRAWLRQSEGVAA